MAGITAIAPGRGCVPAVEGLRRVVSWVLHEKVVVDPSVQPSPAEPHQSRYAAVGDVLPRTPGTATPKGVRGSTGASQTGVAEVNQGTRRCPEINSLEDSKQNVGGVDVR